MPTQTLPFSILRPVAQPWTPQVDPADILIDATVISVNRLEAKLTAAKAWTLDVETRGVAAWLPGTMVVGVGFAWLNQDGSIDAKYFDRQSMSKIAWENLLYSVSRASQLGAQRGQIIGNHNILFDASMWAMEWSRAVGGLFDPHTLIYTHCTYGLYKQLAGEGWFGQRWGLKDAQLDLLGWEDRGDVDLERWLIAHGHHKRGPKVREGLSPEAHLAEVEAWLAVPTKSGKRKSAGVNKGEMWRAPPEILGRYCILDAISTLQLLTDVLLPALEGFPELAEFHTGPWVDLIYLLVEQQFTGIRVDRPRLEAHAASLKAKIAALDVGLRKSGPVAEVVKLMERVRFDAEMAKLCEKRPEQFKRRRDLKPPKCARITRRGAVSKAWVKYEAGLARPAELAPSFANWSGKVEALRQAQVPSKRVSFASNDDVAKILFSPASPGKRALLLTKDGMPPQPEKHRRGTFHVDGKHGFVELELTKAGKLAVGTDTLAQLPKWGEALLEFRELSKELTYVETYLEQLVWHAGGDRPEGGDASAEGAWRLHASWKVPGTVTGRLAGADPNLSQIPKSLELLRCFIPDPGTVWMEADWCLHPKTEVLTRTAGWIPVCEVDKANHEVWQVDAKTLEGSWVTPQRVVKKNYSGPLHIFGNIRGSLSVTENHRMLWLGQQTHARQSRRALRRECLAQDSVVSTAPELAVSTIHTSVSCHSETEIWMACMLQADARLNPSGSFGIEVAVDRKRQKVRELLGRFGTVTQPHGMQKLETERWYGIQFRSNLLRAKTLVVSDLGSEFAEVLLAALAFWDGHVDKSGTVVFTSCDESTIDSVQGYFVRCGYEAKKVVKREATTKHSKCWRLLLRKKTSFRLRKQDHKIETYTGQVGCVTVPSGYILVRSEGQTFVTGNCAVEPHVLAELSRDAGLMKLYGPGAKPHDRYLFSVANYPVAIGDRVRQFYDVDDPTKESVALAKKECKTERAIGKVLCLSSDYGAGWRKQFRKLQSEGVKVTETEVQAINAAHRELHAGVYEEFGPELEKEWRRRGGYVLNGLGFPICIAEEKLKDCINRVIQSTAHYIHVMLVYELSIMLRSSAMPVTGIVWDYHDQFIIQIPQEAADFALTAAKDAVTYVNEELGTTVKLKADPRIVADLGEAKMEEEYAKAQKRA